MFPSAAVDRRRAPRRVPAADEPISVVRFRAGSQVTVLDISDAGALVEGVARLLPGTHVDMHIVIADGRILVRSRVVRAFVSHVEADVIRYRGALAFERSVDTAVQGYALPDLLGSDTSARGNGYPDGPSPISERHHEHPSATDF